MISKLLTNPETRHIFIYIGAAGICALIGGGVYAAAIHAVTPTLPHEIVHQQVLQIVPAQPAPGQRTVTFKGQILSVNISDTEATREKGLSGRQGLAENEGMLFVFPADGIYAFWMKDMLFSIDILWFASDGTLVYMVPNAPPESYPASFTPDKSSRYVLELPAGWAKAHSAVLGDHLQL